jgi:tRNA nucleotidyltransferase/poly(A) polymerase
MAAIKLMREITKKGYEALIVGGFVRDILLGVNSKDIDLCTNMPMDVILQNFKTHDIGKNKQFGILVVDYMGYSFEVAQYRKDSYSDIGGKGADTVEVVDSFKEDSSRRDFKINSLGIDFKGNVVDHHNGLKDIKSKIISSVGDPLLRFKEDSLRIMRAVRLSSKLGFDIDKDTGQAIKDSVFGLKDISIERIRDEFLKMASQEGSLFANSILSLDEYGILEIILPEIVKLKDFKENIEHHPEAHSNGGQGRVFDHVISALRKNKIVDPIINLSILFHDIAKNELTYDKKEGKHTYHGHAKKSKEIIDDLTKRLKLNNKQKDGILFSAINHMKIHNATGLSNTKILELVSNDS